MSELQGSDWEQVFGYADGTAMLADGPSVSTTEVIEQDTPTDPFSIGDVIEIYGQDEGEHDEQNWVAAGLLKDGRHFFISAGCDYTGWD